MFKRIVTLLAGVSALLLLNACTSQHIVDIEGRDDNGFRTLQTSFPITQSGAPVYLKLRGSRTSADFVSLVPDGKYIFFEDIQLTGPGSIAVESDISTMSVSVGFFEPLMDSQFTGSAFLGVSQTQFDADLAFQDGPQLSIRDRIREAYVDMGFWYQATDKFKLGMMFALSMNADVSGYSEVEFFLGYKLFSHMELAVGLRDFTYDYNEGESRSTLRVQSRGPFIMLNFPF